MIGEASHGTQEFYQMRAEITKRLIEEKGFRAICIEADWPDAYRVNRFIQRGRNCRDTTPRESLRDFAARFPLWMWRNQVMEEFVGWLRYVEAMPQVEDTFLKKNTQIILGRTMTSENLWQRWPSTA